MHITVHPGGSVGGEARVPGDKSIAHRWLVLAATARGGTELQGVPRALDVRSTARVLAALAPEGARASLEAWASEAIVSDERDRSTANDPEPRPPSLALEGGGRGALHAPGGDLDCGNSGTSMRLLAGVLASCPFESRLVGDRSLSARPMERVAEPLRAMGAEVDTADGRAPITIRGGPLAAIRYAAPIASAQVKGAVLLAGLDAEGETTVVEPSPTRDHTERALAHLGAPVRAEGLAVTLSAFGHEGFSASVPGDVSSAAFLLAAVALTGGRLVIHGVGLNPTRTHLLKVLERMGVRTRSEVAGEQLGEPVGTIEVEPCDGLLGTTVTEVELPLVIDEVPVLAILAAHARGETRFLGAGELRKKESDRLGGIEAAIRALGGEAGAEGDDLVLPGGGLRGGTASSRDDHRLAMAIAVAGLGARSPVTVDGIEAADVSFPAFVRTLSELGARIDR
jgi:3-phosphoshikimate 1-carboxyvinyltransferase